MADSSKPSPPELKTLKPALPDVWDLAKLEASVNATSQRAVTQWLAYLSLWAYLFFTTLSITHRDLILLTPVKLPLIGVELGLREYFWAGPPLFWVFHLYLVRKITVLARDVAFYRAVMKRIVSSAAAREPLYRRLDAFFLTRLLGYREQGRLLRWLDGGIAVATVVVMPLALMVAFQLYYLAYHDPDATDWHRGWLVADVLLLAIPLLWRLWGRSREANGLVNGKRRRLRGWVVVIGKTLGLTLAFGGCVAFSLAIATFPDDRMDWALSAVGLSGKNHPLSSLRVLAPRDTDFVNDEKLDKVQWTVDLRGRDLRGANLSGADLRKARMTGVKLQGADLRQSDLRQANLSSASMDEINIDQCQCQGVNMAGAKLRSARLNYSHFNGADLRGIYFDGSYMSESHFQFSNMEEAKLIGVVSRMSEYQWSNMMKVIFNGSDLTSSNFEKANLEYSSFVGSDLHRVIFYGANFTSDLYYKSMRYRIEYKKLMEMIKLREMIGVNSIYEKIDPTENIIGDVSEEKYRKEEDDETISGVFDFSENPETIIYSNINQDEINLNKWISQIPSSEAREKITSNVKKFFTKEKQIDNELKDKINSIISYSNFSKSGKENFLTKLSCDYYPDAIHGVVARIHYNYNSMDDEYIPIESLKNDENHMDQYLSKQKENSKKIDYALIARNIQSSSCSGEKRLKEYERYTLDYTAYPEMRLLLGASMPPEYPQ